MLVELYRTHVKAKDFQLYGIAFADVTGGKYVIR